MLKRNKPKSFLDYLKIIGAVAIVATILAQIIDIKVGVAYVACVIIYIFIRNVILKNMTSPTNDGLEERDLVSLLIVIIGFIIVLTFLPLIFGK